jgi:signal transduction histidine kinase
MQDLQIDAAPDGQFTALERVRHADRSSAIEHLLSHLAHQLGSPLNVIEARAAMMASGQVVEGDIGRQARIIAEQAGRIAQILRDVMAFCRRGGRENRRIDVKHIVELAVGLFAPLASARHAAISLERPEAPIPPVVGNPDTLLVALTHVLDNGLRATPDGGTLRVRLRTEERPEDPAHGTGRATYACFDVDDDGPGIDATVATRLFKPFSSMSRTDEPRGMGLFIAQAIARDHGGWIEGVNKNGKGARFTLHLPSEQQHAQQTTLHR